MRIEHRLRRPALDWLGQPAVRIIERSVASQGRTCGGAAAGRVLAKKRANGMRVRREWEVSMVVLLLKLLWVMHGRLSDLRLGVTALR